MICFPHSKINLGLNILQKRADGYHDLETVFYPVPLCDILEILPSEQFAFKQSGLTVEGNENDNLCIKAFKLLQEKFNIDNVYIHLHKQIPMGAGMGGGSSDAAYVIRMCNDLFSLGMTTEEMQSYAAELGSDCAYFINDTPMYGKGRGEILSPLNINLNGYYLKIVNPGIHISTAEAFKGVHKDANRLSLAERISQPIYNWKGLIENDFEVHLFNKYPELEKIKSTFYKEGAVYAALSGSGSTLYAIYPKEPVMSFLDYAYEHILAL